MPRRRPARPSAEQPAGPRFDSPEGEPGASPLNYRKALARLGDRPAPPPAERRALSTADREAIRARREPIAEALLVASFIAPDLEDEEIEQLAAEYGWAELDAIHLGLMCRLSGLHPITDEATQYRRYRRAFALFGAGRPLLARPEFGERIAEHAEMGGRRTVAALEEGEQDEQASHDERDGHGEDVPGPSEHEVELRELTLAGSHLWEDLAEPAVPPRPPDFAVPPPGAYGAPLAELLAWGPPAADEQAHAARVAALVAQDPDAWRAAAGELTRMATDPGLVRGWPGEPASWAPCHALDALAALGPAVRRRLQRLPGARGGRAGRGRGARGAGRRVPPARGRRALHRARGRGAARPEASLSRRRRARRPR